jgi:hypothetical protein
LTCILKSRIQNLESGTLASGELFVL